MRKIFLFTILIYILTLLQTSFFVHFGFFNYLPNLILILVILINLLERQENSSGIWLAGIGGFFLDIFSQGFFKGFFGFQILILLGIAILIKLIFKKYVRVPISKRA